jgi:L-asparagine oxygenase
MTMKIFQLSPAQQNELRQAYAGVPSPYAEPYRALTGLFKAFGVLPAPLLHEVLQFGRDPSSPGCMLIDGLPIDEQLPDTPVAGTVPKERPSLDSEKSLLGLAQLVGTPVGYLTEKEGQLVHHVVPMQGGEYTQSNRGSKVFLTFHNDSMFDESMVFNSHNPDYLLLLCPRGDHAGEARTLYADARLVCAELPPTTRDLLRQPRFRMAAPSNYTLLIHGAKDGEKVWSQPVPILSGPAHLPEIYIAANGVQALDPHADEALAALLQACQRVGERHSVRLAPGQAMLINNRKGVHARTVFEARYDGHDRWLLRANIRTSLWSIRDRATRDALVFA